jgi:Glycosyltransferase sugar-binding region containing DXD motif
MLSLDLPSREPVSEVAPPLRAQPAIPLRAHFVWFGAQFPWVNLLAVRSAAVRGGFTELVLHHDSDLSTTPYFDELVAIPGLRLARLRIPELLRACEPYGPELGLVFDRLRTPAVRSDLVRLALLHSQGGVYLDLDTVTVRELAALCQGVQGFVGQERIVYPAEVVHDGGMGALLSGSARSLARSAFRLVPRGWLAFRHIEHLFHLAVNPAVIAATARSRFITLCIEQMLRTPRDRQAVPYVLGPHLLQQTLASYQGTDVAVYPPEVFFPLAPELSTHWFRQGSGQLLSSAISPHTRVVHWYASVRTRHITPWVDPDYVQKHAATQLFSALALPFIRA